MPGGGTGCTALEFAAYLDSGRPRQCAEDVALRLEARKRGVRAEA